MTHSIPQPNPSATPLSLEEVMREFDRIFHHRRNGHWFHTVNVCANPDDVDEVTGTTDTAWAVPESFKSFIQHAYIQGMLAKQEEDIKLIKEHNVRILNEFQMQGKPDMPMIAYDERVCLIPAIKNATEETISAITAIRE